MEMLYSTHNPHSFKSELLRTLVTALAATHSPDELNLVLVDFKGGATFLGCDHLPHTSAVITNLEEESTLVERMYDAISGEMNRRQELLRAAGNFANITDYNAARESTRPDLDPLPSLVIVVDEFATLVEELPGFVPGLVGIAQRERLVELDGFQVDLDHVGRRRHAVGYDELMGITEVWVDTALALGERSLRTMDRIVKAQTRRSYAAHPGAVAL